MTIAEIVEIESNRNSPEQFAVVHLIKEQGGFYRAHDWSAWLMTNFPVSDVPLQISAKKLKDGYIEAWVGFPVTSLGKYVPESGNITFTPINDNQIDITIPLPDEYKDAEFDTLRAAVDDWKGQLPINAGKKQKREDREVAEVAPRFPRITDIIGRILAFPLAEKSPMEAWQFVRQLQQQTASIF